MFFSFFILSLKANSSKEFQEGYIISLKGDTIKGFLLEQDNKKVFKKCVFKSNIDDESKTYEPFEIGGYRYLNGKYYISKEISIDSTTKKLVFLEFLIKGIANVYYYADIDEHYYIEKLPNGIIELTEKEKTFYQKTNYEDHLYVSPSRYKGKLSFLMQDCPDIKDEIQNTNLNHKSLIKLTKNYHNKVCSSESCIIYERKNLSAKMKFGLLMGVSRNQYNFGGQLISDYQNSYQVGAGLKISNIFMFNGHFNLKTNFIIEKDSKSYTLHLPDDVLAKYNDESYIIMDYYKIRVSDYAIVTYNDVSYHVTDYYENPSLRLMKFNLNVIDLKIPITLNYDFNISKNTIYNFGFGLSNKIILSQNKDFKINRFYTVYGKSINSYLPGGILTTGIEGNWFGKHSVFINMVYEYLFDVRSRVDTELCLRNNQFSLQAGIYF